MEGRRGREGGREREREMGEGGGKREREEKKCTAGVREERDREYREQRKGRGAEDKGQWMYDSGKYM